MSKMKYVGLGYNKMFAENSDNSETDTCVIQ